MTARLPDSARVEIDCRTLARLLARGELQVCSLRCLDPESKKLVRQVMLNNCIGCPHSSVKEERWREGDLGGERIWSE